MNMLGRGKGEGIYEGGRTRGREGIGGGIRRVKGEGIYEGGRRRVTREGIYEGGIRRGKSRSRLMLAQTQTALG